MRSRGWFLTTAATALAVDAASKVAAVRYLADSDVELIGSAIALRLGYNSGVAFGLGAAIPSVVVTAVTAVVTACIAVAGWRDALGHPVAAGLVLGGALGNVLDRMLGGGVVDMIDIGSWPTFNVADTLLNLGVIAAVLKGLGRSDQSRRPDRRR